MELKEIAAISGKSGLYRILKPTRSGVIVESLDELRSKIVAGASNKISILQEISIYTTSAEGSVPLKDVLVKIYGEFGDDPGVNQNSSSEELKAFVKHVVPDYDEDRVYVSDMKKLLAWYQILVKFAPEVFTEQEQEQVEEQPEVKVDEGKVKKQEAKGETGKKASEKKAKTASSKK
jgi:hypothetical protein